MGSAGIQPQVREALLQRLQEARASTDAFFGLVRPQGLYDERPIPERHRLIFYLGHLEAFDWNLVGRAALDLKPFHAEFDWLFAFGIDPVDGNLPADKPSDWPARPEIEDYNRSVRQTLDTALQAADWSDPARPYLCGGLIVHAAIEHRLMHAETLVYLLHHLSPANKVAPSLPPEPSVPPAAPRQVTIPAGTATLGLRLTEEAPFGWDNEFEAHQVQVPAFSLGAFPVTNREYQDFVRAGGYREPGFWSEDAWQWKEERGLAHPYLWRPQNGGWTYRARFAVRPLPLDWPVHVSHAEASAYARWAGKRLPTEAEWHRAAYGTPQGGERLYPWGEQPPTAVRGNFDFQCWDPTPVTAHPAGASAFGVEDLVGNGWEWTATPFAPFAGFRPYPFYPGYSANFFDDRHYVVKGGSMRTAACLLRRSFRNWFQPHYPYIPAKFRLVEG